MSAAIDGMRRNRSRSERSAERHDTAHAQGQRDSGGGFRCGRPLRFRRAPGGGADGAQRTHQFTPTKFYNYFSSKYEPVLHVAPGDTIETWSVDAGGIDASGKRRSPGGNPLTGPFFVDGAWPGDTLVVKLNRVRLTRDTAVSGDQIVPTALGPGYYRNLKFDEKFSSEWTLDRASRRGPLDQAV